MKIRHVPIHVDLALFVAAGQKRMTFRPMKPQPVGFDAVQEKLIFGDGAGALEVYLEDYPCPFGEPGDLIVLYFEGNGERFYEGKVMRRGIKRLEEITDEEVKREGWTRREEFFSFWDLLYGETEYAAVFNPFVWAVSFN